MQRVINYGIATVWIVNGLWCKVLNFVPRHQTIVAKIMGATHAPLLTTAIGIGEILIAIWVISGIKPTYCAVVQIGLIVVMNIIELVLVPDLLLWGYFNFVFAIAFAYLIYYNAYVLANR